MPKNEFYTTKQLSEMLRVSDITILHLANKGELVGFKVGREWRFTTDAVQDFIAKTHQVSSKKLPAVTVIPKKITSPAPRVPPVLICTRHAVVYEWLVRNVIFPEGMPLMLEEANVEDVKGKIVIGELPMPMIPFTERFYRVEIPGLQSHRDLEKLTPTDLNRMGANVKQYVITKTPISLDGLAAVLRECYHA